MRYQRSLNKYLRQCSADRQRPFVYGSLANIDAVVVIPCLAESKSVFTALGSIARNPKPDLERTLVLCVINNRSVDIVDHKIVDDNRRTMQLLDILIKGDNDVRHLSAADRPTEVSYISASGLRAAYIDASSLGYEMPEKGGGVGTARKIGMDKALTVLDYERRGIKLLCCLDADTIVEENYLSSVRSFFLKNNATAARVSFSHQQTHDLQRQAAICCYEIFLRYYVLGLNFADSPYAFHTVGSTMICTDEAYAAVRGMNRRDAAEDFYFLNKLAKLNGVCVINTTAVHPSARVSDRVPFGTGQSIARFLRGSENEYLVYAPEIFNILRKWLRLVECSWTLNGDDLVNAAGSIHHSLELFLRRNDFIQIWGRIKKNSGTSTDTIKRQYHEWFDGLRTLKLIHYLTDCAIPKEEMFIALDILLMMMDKAYPREVQIGKIPDIETQMGILHYLRETFP